MKHLVLMMSLFFSANALVQTAPAPANSLTAGSWKVDGNVEGVPVILTCAIVETDKVLSGSCTGDDGATHTIKGKVVDRIVTWAFDSAYQGQPITVTLSGTLDATGLKMSGAIAVDPLQADGLFTAAKLPVVPAAATKPPSLPMSFHTA